VTPSAAPTNADQLFARHPVTAIATPPTNAAAKTQTAPMICATCLAFAPPATKRSHINPEINATITATTKISASISGIFHCPRNAH
jgi:hypothetical protein